MSRCWIALGLLALAGVAGAHPLAPALWVLESEGESVAVRWQVTPGSVAARQLQPRWPAVCETRSASVPDTVRSAERRQWTLHCPGGLAGQALRVDGLAATPVNVILRWQPHGAAPQTWLLDAGQPSVTLPQSGGARAVLPQYLALGVEHLLLGPDHVLFVLGIVLLVRGGRRLVWTLSAFTLGHSLTLALAATGQLRVWPALTEWLIAVSLFWLALEAARPPAQRRGAWQRQPALLAFGFGLFHGLGFAGVLAEVGLPAGALLPALLGFNLGIELGQLLLVALLLAVAALRHRVWRRPPAWAPVLPVYLMGGLAAFWCLERAGPLWGGLG